MPDPARPRVTVQFFHPFPSRSKANRALWQAIQDIPGVEARDLYALYPEFAIDVDREQEVLSRSDIVVFQHPFYWYNCPSLMKEWLDSVLELGWAYGDGGDKLRGKRWVQAITTGGGDSAYHRSGYNRFSMDELLRPFEQSARLCGMIYTKPFVTHGTFRVSESELADQADRYRQYLFAMTRGQLPPECQTDLCEEVRL